MKYCDISTVSALQMTPTSRPRTCHTLAPMTLNDGSLEDSYHSRQRKFNTGAATVPILIVQRVLHSLQRKPYSLVKCQYVYTNHLEGDLLESVEELLALDGSNLDLKGRRLTRTVGTCKGTSAPGRAATNLRDVRELSKGVLVAKGNEDDAVVSQSGDRVDSG